MKKILPFDCNPIVKTYPYFADYLGALKANGYEIDNILEHYFICINYIPFTGQVNFQHKASLRNSLKYHKYDVESIDIIDFVKTNIIKNNCFRFLLFIIFCIGIISSPFNAYAVNSDLISDEMYWIDRGEETIYDEDYFKGFSKYIVDENEGCFYFFVSFTDKRVDTNSNDNFTLGLTVENDINTYSFQVDKDGVKNSESKNSIENAEIYCNFDRVSNKKQGGNIFIAVKLKDKTDRKKTNYITCEYFCGRDLNYNLVENIVLDMYVPEIAKTTSQKEIKTTTTKNKTQTVKISESKNESSTKFSGAETQNTPAKSNAKFSAASIRTTENNSDSDTIQTSFDEIQAGKATVPADVNIKQTLSQKSKLMMIIFTTLALVGTICIFIGIAKNKSSKNVEEDNSDSLD